MATKKTKPSPKKPTIKADRLDFNFGANVRPSSKRRGGKGGGS
jgi:hypothetical protein